MTTAIIGVGLLGTALARNLVGGGEAVVLAAQNEDHAARLANDLGALARAASVSQAIAAADTVVFAVWLDTLTSLVSDNADVLKGKVVLDPTNPIRVDASGAFVRSLPEGQSAGSVVVRFYATDDAQAAATAERLILAAGFDPVKAGDMKDAARIEGPDGDLSQFGLRGALVDVDQARAAVAATAGV